MPRRIRSRRIASELQAGPTVQMILARRMVEVAGDGSTSARFGEDFPFFKFVPIKVFSRSIYCIWRESPRRMGECTNGRVYFYFRGCPSQAETGRGFSWHERIRGGKLSTTGSFKICAAWD